LFIRVPSYGEFLPYGGSHHHGKRYHVRSAILKRLAVVSERLWPPPG